MQHPHLKAKLMAKGKEMEEMRIKQSNEISSSHQNGSNQPLKEFFA